MSRVVVVKNEGVTSGLAQADYYRLLTAGLTSLAGDNDLSAAVGKYIPPGTVGFKTNCLTRRNNSTPVALIDALCQVLTEAGHTENQLVVWERTSRELEGAGFGLNASGRKRRCLGTDANGVGYSREFHSYGRVDSLVSRILTELVDCNINVPVLKDHSVAGLSGAMKNMYGAIHNPNKFHDNNCDPFCAHVNNLEPIRTRNKLAVIDAVRVQYDRGPGYVPQYTAWYGGLIISDDPVAADRIGLEIVARLRADHGRPPLEAVKREVRYLKTAAAIGLGVENLSRIDLVVLKDGVPTGKELF